MRTLTLSDHPGDLLDQLGRSRRPDAADTVAQGRRARDQARAQRRWWAWLLAALALRREVRRVGFARSVQDAQVADRRQAVLAGQAGERSVADTLGRVLGDEWMAFRGYCNRRGEIDLLLVGPRGLVAVEVKNLNGTVHCDGDRWRFVKYDRYGNAVKEGVIEDRTGRSPSRQVNEAASELADFLHDRGHDVAIERVVLFAHERAQLGECKNATVRIATSAQAVARLATGGRRALSASTQAEIERLVVADHEHNERRRRRRTP